MDERNCTNCKHYYELWHWEYMPTGVMQKWYASEHCCAGFVDAGEVRKIVGNEEACDRWENKYNG